MVPDVDLIALDPGVTTGACVVYKGGVKPVSKTTLRTRPHYFKTTELVGHMEVWAFLEEHKPRRIVSESFRLYANKAQYKINSGFPEIETIGVIRLWAQMHDVPMDEQAASFAKGAFDDETLTFYGVLPKSRHERDAVRHALLFYRREASRKCR